MAHSVQELAAGHPRKGLAGKHQGDLHAGRSEVLELRTCIKR
jgi:hypothetical protein